MLFAVRNVANGTKRHFAAAQQMVALGGKADMAGRVKCVVRCDKRFALLILHGTGVLSRWFHGNFIFVDIGSALPRKKQSISKVGTRQI